MKTLHMTLKKLKAALSSADYCGVSDNDIIMATICGEAGNCSNDTKRRVWQVVFNRAKKLRSLVSRGVIKDANEYVAEAIRPSIGYPIKNDVHPSEFISWNDDANACAGDAFKTCEAFQERVTCLKSKCFEPDISIENFDSSPKALEEIGFTKKEAEKVLHYMSESDFMSWGKICEDAKQKVADSNKKCVTVTCKGKKHRICSDACFVFISGVDVNG